MLSRPTRSHPLFVAVLIAMIASLVMAPPASADAATVSISGVLRDDMSLAIPEASVSAFAYDEYDKRWEIKRSAQTTTDGSYSFSDLPAGTYRVGLVGGFNQRTWAPTFWQGAQTVEEASDITLAAGGAAADVDLTSAPASELSGVVSLAGTNEVTSLNVKLHRRIVTGGVTSWIEIESLSVGGPYTFAGLAAGTYRVQLITYAQSHITEFWENAATLEDAKDIVLAPGQHLTGISGELRKSPQFSGKVTGVNGAPVAGVEVEVMRMTSTPSGPYWDPFYHVTTAADGTFTGNIRPGQYKFMYRKDGYTTTFWQNATSVEDAAIATLVEGTPLVVDTQMVRKGSISGLVTSGQGDPLAEVKATLYVETEEDGDTYWEESQSRTTYGDGRYSFTDVRAGRYVVGFTDTRGRYAAEYWEDVPSFEQANEIVVDTGATIAGIDAVLERGGSISGRVSSAAEFSPEAVAVTAYQLVDLGDGEDWVEIGLAWPDWQGFYTIDGLAPGDYRVGYFDYLGAVRAEYWKDAAELDDADDIRVEAGAGQPGKDAILDATPQIVNTAPPSISGTPVPGGTLTADRGRWNPEGGSLGYEWLANGVEIDGADTPTYVPTVADLGKRISVRVTAWNIGYQPSTVSSLPVTIIPSAPGSLALSSRTATSLHLAWAASPGATSYQVDVRTNGRTRTIRVGNQTSVKIDRLDPARSHQVTVRAAHPAGGLSAGTSVTASTVGVAAPTRLKAAKRSKSSVTLRWTKSEGAARYRISYRAPGQRKKVATVGDKSSVTIRKLKGKKAYSFTVEAISADGRSRKVSKALKVKTR